MKDELLITLDVVIASFLTMFVGLEREKADKAAGIRTNMIVGGFSCLVLSLSKSLIGFVSESMLPDSLNSDPLRVFEAVVVGVSFIGAGTIIKSASKERVVGLTTAATLLYSSGIGLCTGLGMYALATLLTVFILIINYVINLLGRKIK